MPNTSRVMVKASIVYLCLGALIGALLFVNRWIPIEPHIASLRTSHIQMLIVGWLTQLILGVGWWLLPPLTIGLRPGSTTAARRAQATRGSEPLFWAAFACLNAGVLLASVGEPLASWTGLQGMRTAAGSADLLFLVAAVAYVANVWQRVRAVGSRP